MTWLLVGLLVLDGALLAAIPLFSRRTTPLGVSVPSSRLAEPVIRRSVQGFQVTCGVLTLVAVVGGLLSVESYPASVASWVILQLVAGLAAYGWWRRPIMAAKREGQWYAGAQVRVSASITEVAPVRGYWWLHALSFVLLGGVAAVVAANYGALPDPYPVHWGASGKADRFEPKSWWAVSQVLVIGAIMALGMLVLAVVLAHRRESRLPDGDPVAAEAAAALARRRVLLVLASSSLLMVLTFGVIALVPLVQLAPQALNVLLWPLVAASTVVPIVVLIGVARARMRVGATVHDGPESPDDDAFWKLGMFYVNPDDPSVMVPKRAGVGYDMNYAHPVGKVFAGFAILVVVATLVLPWLV